MVLLDNVLRKYGPDTAALRAELRRDVHAIYRHIENPDSVRRYAKDSPNMQHPLEHFEQGMKMLKPTNDMQKTLQDRMLSLIDDIETIQWNLIHGAGNSLSVPFIAAMVLWFSAVFVGFGTVTANNLVVLVTLLICALSISAAIFLGMEMSSPFSGLVNVTLEPLENALEQIGR